MKREKAEPKPIEFPQADSEELAKFEPNVWKCSGHANAGHERAAKA
jgi:hypothetical protein